MEPSVYARVWALVCKHTANPVSIVLKPFYTKGKMLENIQASRVLDGIHAITDMQQSDWTEDLLQVPKLN